jgi:hypothetical protein
VSPCFANSACGDFDLLPASPAVDRGLPSLRVMDDYNEMPRGPSPDLGAYER